MVYSVGSYYTVTLLSFNFNSLLICTSHSHIQNADTSTCIILNFFITSQMGCNTTKMSLATALFVFGLIFLLLIFDNYVFHHPSLIAVTAVILIKAKCLSLCTVRLPTNIFTKLRLVMPTHLYIFTNKILFKIIFSTVITSVYIVIAALITYI